MSHRGAGIGLLAFAAALFIGRDLAAAIFYPANAGVYGAKRFAQWRDYVSSAPIILSAVALVLGLGYLAWAEWDALRDRKEGAP
jgi:hypothetical protein